MVKTVTLGGYQKQCSLAGLPQQVFVLKNGKSGGLQISHYVNKE